MKVLIITRGKLPLPNIKGGAVEYLIQLLIDENERTWHDAFTVVSIAAEGLEKVQETYKYCEFINIDLSSMQSKLNTVVRYLINTKVKYIGNSFIAETFKHLNNHLDDYDVVIDENAPDFLPLIRKKYKGRVVFHSHNDWIDDRNSSILNNCDEYWTISKYLLDKLSKEQLLCKTKVLYNGIDIEKYANPDQNCIKAFRERFGIRTDDIVLIYAGRIVPEKGVLEMLKAFRNCGFHKNVKLLIAGGHFYSSDKITPYIEECQKYADDTVIFTGYVAGKEMPALYATAAIGMFPSRCQEAFGLTVLEMMSGGLPVITTTNGAIPEIVDDHCGFLIPTQNEDVWIQNMTEKMKLLVEDAQLRKTMGKAGRLRAEDFTARAYLENFHKFLRS